MKKKITFFCLMTLAFSLYAQNEASKNFVKNAVLARQEGSSFDKFPKMEIGFVGRNDNAQPMAFLFIRLQSALETGGGIFTSFYGLNRNTNQLEKSEGDAFRQFVSLLSQFTITVDVSKMRKATSIDIELGEFELTDFQWYMTENQWKSNRNKTVRIKAKVMTANNENRLYFYRTSDVRDYRNEFETFTMPNEVYLTEKQCRQIVDAYEKENSFVWKAVEAAIDSAKRAMR